MPATLRYPLSNSTSSEVPLAVAFNVADYSLKNFERTRDGIINNSLYQIILPMPKEPGYSAIHQFGEGQNPVGPVMSLAGVANSGGMRNFGTLYSRVMAPITFFTERQFSTDTYRRFSNITELTMISEARKSYYFEYMFVPKSATESAVVADIIGTFRKGSYPVVASGMPERSYPQRLWTIDVLTPTQAPGILTPSPTADWLGEPLPCVLSGMVVKHADAGDPVVRYLPDGRSSAILLGLNFTEFETGTYVPAANAIWSKSEISDYYFGYSEE